MSSNYRANECWKAEISAAGKVTAESLVLIIRACSYIFWSFCTAGQKILPNAPLNILLGVWTSIEERVVQLRMIPISLFEQEPRCTNKHKGYFFFYFFLFVISLLVSVCNFTTRHRRAGSLRLPRSLHRDWQCLNLPSHFFPRLAAADWSRSLSNKRGLSAHFQAQALPASPPACLTLMGRW